MPIHCAFTGRTMFLLLICLTMSVPALGAEPLVYRDTTGDRQSEYTWSLEKGMATAAITVRKSDVTFVNHILETGETVAWSQVGRDAAVNATVSDGVLRLVGLYKGEQLNRTTDLEGLPWLQPLSYALPRLVREGQDGLLFWTIRPDTLEPVKLKAEYKGCQTVEVNGEQVSAFKIRIAPPGMLSMFWHGDYWYRQDDARFLRYEALSGPPGSPKTRVTLVGEPTPSSGVSG